MLTLLRIRFYPFPYRSVLHVNTTPDTFENGMKTTKRSHCSALDKKENATKWFTALATAFCCVVVVFSVFKSICFRCSHCVLRFQKSPLSKVSVFAAEQCERKVNTDTFLSVSLESGAM